MEGRPSIASPLEAAGSSRPPGMTSTAPLRSSAGRRSGSAPAGIGSRGKWRWPSLSSSRHAAGRFLSAGTDLPRRASFRRIGGEADLADPPPAGAPPRRVRAGRANPVARRRPRTGDPIDRREAEGGRGEAACGRGSDAGPAEDGTRDDQTDRAGVPVGRDGSPLTRNPAGQFSRSRSTGWTCCVPVSALDGTRTAVQLYPAALRSRSRIRGGDAWGERCRRERIPPRHETMSGAWAEECSRLAPSPIGLRYFDTLQES